MGEGTEPRKKMSEFVVGRNGDDPYVVYLLRCSDDTIYTGQTNDLERRIAEHNAGRGAKYTAGRRPVTLVHTETFATRAGAMRREASIKALSRPEKERLVEKTDV